MSFGKRDAAKSAVASRKGGSGPSSALYKKKEGFERDSTTDSGSSLKCRHFQTSCVEKGCDDCPPCIVFTRLQTLLSDVPDCVDASRFQLQLFVRLTASDKRLSSKGKNMLKDLTSKFSGAADGTGEQVMWGDDEPKLKEFDLWFEGVDQQVQSLFLVLLLKQCADLESSILSLVPDVMRWFQKSIDKRKEGDVEMKDQKASVGNSNGKAGEGSPSQQVPSQKRLRRMQSDPAFILTSIGKGSQSALLGNRTQGKHRTLSRAAMLRKRSASYSGRCSRLSLSSSNSGRSSRESRDPMAQVTEKFRLMKQQHANIFFDHVARLPAELSGLIFGMLSDATLAACLLVNRSWHRISVKAIANRICCRAEQQRATMKQKSGVCRISNPSYANRVLLPLPVRPRLENLSDIAKTPIQATGIGKLFAGQIPEAEMQTQTSGSASKSMSLLSRRIPTKLTSMNSVLKQQMQDSMSQTGGSVSATSGQASGRVSHAVHMLKDSEENFIRVGLYATMKDFFSSRRHTIYEERNVYCGSYNYTKLLDSLEQKLTIHNCGGEYVLVGTAGKRLLVLCANGDQHYAINAHAAAVHCVHINENVGLFFSGSYDLTIRCWSLATGKITKIFIGHQQSVTCLDANDSQVVSGSKDCTVRVWDIASGHCVDTYKQGEIVTVVKMWSDCIISGDKRGQIRYWLPQRERACKVVWVHTRAITDISLTASYIATSSEDCFALVWSASLCEEKPLAVFQHPRSVTAVAMLYLRLVTGSVDGRICLWNVLTGDCLRELMPDGPLQTICSLFARKDKLYVGLTDSVSVYTFDPIELDYNSEPFCKPKYRVPANTNIPHSQENEHEPQLSVHAKEPLQGKGVPGKMSAKEVFPSSWKKVTFVHDYQGLKLQRLRLGEVPLGKQWHQQPTERTSSQQLWRSTHNPLTCASLLTGDGEITTLQLSTSLSSPPRRPGQSDSEAHQRAVSAPPLWHRPQLTAHISSLPACSLSSPLTAARPKPLDGSKHKEKHLAANSGKQAWQRARSIEDVPGSHLPLLALNRSTHKIMRLHTYSEEQFAFN